MKNSFQSFLKTPKYKTIDCFDKTTGCFSLSLKNTFSFKKIENAYALDSIKSGLQNSIYPRSYLRQLNNNKHNLAFNILQRVLDSSKLEHHLVQQIIPLWIHPPNPCVCEWRSVRPHHRRAPQRNLWESHWRKRSLVKDNPGRILLANYERGLCGICATMRAVSEACRLASCAN